MKIPAGMTDGGNHPAAQKVREYSPPNYLGATLFQGDLSLHIKKEGLLDICRFLRDDPALDFDYPIHITSVDHFGEPERFEIVYELFSIRRKQAVRLKTRVSEEECSVDSVTEIWKGANYQEREVYDMMGIKFNNHPDLRRILLPDEYEEGYPLRKNFPIEGRGWRDTFEFLES